MAASYITKDGDMWDMIAKEIYGNELLADVLIQANLSKADIFKFDAGTVLSVPDVDEQEAGGLPPWRD